MTLIKKQLIPFMVLNVDWYIICRAWYLGLQLSSVVKCSFQVNLIIKITSLGSSHTPNQTHLMEHANIALFIISNFFKLPQFPRSDYFRKKRLPRKWRTGVWSVNCFSTYLVTPMRVLTVAVMSLGPISTLFLPVNSSAILAIVALANQWSCSRWILLLDRCQPVVLLLAKIQSSKTRP